MRDEGKVDELVFKHLNMILDSGTTLSYLPKKHYGRLLERFKAFCADQKHRCGGVSTFESEVCVEQNKSSHASIDDFLDSFPVLAFGIGHKGVINWRPKDYLMKKQNLFDSSSVIHCLSVIEAHEGMTPTLGSTFMRQHEIFFDRGQLTVQITESSCE